MAENDQNDQSLADVLSDNPYEPFTGLNKIKVTEKKTLPKAPPKSSSEIKNNTIILNNVPDGMTIDEYNKDKNTLGCDEVGMEYTDNGKKCMGLLLKSEATKTFVMMDSGQECFSLKSRMQPLFTELGGDEGDDLKLCVHATPRIISGGVKVLQKWVFKRKDVKNKSIEFHPCAEDVLPNLMHYILKSRTPLPVQYVVTIYVAAFMNCKGNKRVQIAESLQKILNGTEDDSGMRSQLLYKNYSSYFDDTISGTKSTAFDKELSSIMTLFERIDGDVDGNENEDRFYSMSGVDQFINNIFESDALKSRSAAHEQKQMEEYLDAVREELHDFRENIIEPCIEFIKSKAAKEDDTKPKPNSMFEALIHQCGQASEESTLLEGAENPTSIRDKYKNILMGILQGICSSVESGAFKKLRSKPRDASMKSNELFDALDSFYLVALLNVGNVDQNLLNVTSEEDKQVVSDRKICLRHVISYLCNYYMTGKSDVSKKSLTSTDVVTIYPRFTEYMLADGNNGENVKKMIPGYNSINITDVYKKSDYLDAQPSSSNLHRLVYYVALNDVSAEPELWYCKQRLQELLSYSDPKDKSDAVDPTRVSQNEEYFMTTFTAHAASGNMIKFNKQFERLFGIVGNSKENKISEEQRIDNFNQIDMERLLYAAITGGEMKIIVKILEIIMHISNKKITKASNKNINYMHMIIQAVIVMTASKKEDGNIAKFSITWDELKPLYGKKKIRDVMQFKQQTTTNLIELLSNLYALNSEFAKSRIQDYVSMQMERSILPVILLTTALFATQENKDIKKYFNRAVHLLKNDSTLFDKNYKNLIGYIRAIIQYRIIHEDKQHTGNLYTYLHALRSFQKVDVRETVFT